LGEELALLNELRLQLGNAPREVHASMSDGQDGDAIADHIADHNMLTHQMESKPK